MSKLNALQNRPPLSVFAQRATEYWAMHSVLNLAHLLGIEFILAVLALYFNIDIPAAIKSLEAASKTNTERIKTMQLEAFGKGGGKTEFGGGVKIRENKVIPKYDRSSDGQANPWIVENQPDLIRIDWAEFEKRVKADSVGDDCPVKFELQPSASVNNELLIEYHGRPTPAVAIRFAADEPIMELSETAIIYPDTNPEPAPIGVKPQPARLAPLPIEEAPPPGAFVAPVPIEAAPQATGEPQITIVDDRPTSMTANEWKNELLIRAAADKHAKQTKSDDKFPDDIPF